MKSRCSIIVVGLVLAGLVCQGAEAQTARTAAALSDADNSDCCVRVGGDRWVLTVDAKPEGGQPGLPDAWVFSVLDVSKQEVVPVRIPTAPLRQRGAAFLDGEAERILPKGKGRRLAFSVSLVYFDHESGKVGLWVKNRRSARKGAVRIIRQRVLYAAYDIRQQTLEELVMVGEGTRKKPRGGSFWQPGTQVMGPIGHDEERGRLWFYRQLRTEDASGTQLTVAWVGLDGKVTKDVTTFTLPVLDPEGKPRSPRVFLDDGGKQVIVADYAEKWWKKAPEAGAWLTDTTDGTTRRFPTPTTTYGAVTDKGARVLALLSSQHSKVMFLDLESGKTLATVRVPGQAHGLFPALDNSRLLIFARGKQPVALTWPTPGSKTKVKKRKVKGDAISVCPEKVAFMPGTSTGVFRLGDEYGFAAKKGIVIVTFEPRE
jgi:hypothetical protein